MLAHNKGLPAERVEQQSGKPTDAEPHHRLHAAEGDARMKKPRRSGAKFNHRASRVATSRQTHRDNTTQLVIGWDRVTDLGVLQIG
jgi:hypothetical protein